MKSKQRPDFIPSRLFIYYNERTMEGAVANDAGASLRDGIKSVNKLGVCPEPEWPYDDTPAPYEGGPFPLNSKPVTKPSRKCYSDARNYEAVQYQRLSQSLSQLKGCLAEGFPFVFGFSVYDSLYDSRNRPKVVVPLPSMADRAVGGHAVGAVGYDDAKQLFIVRNSWGKKQESGYFYMPYAYLTDPNLASDFWVIRTVSE
jgi:C1A family cysteine protease